MLSSDIFGWLLALIGDLIFSATKNYFALVFWELVWGYIKFVSTKFLGLTLLGWTFGIFISDISKSSVVFRLGGPDFLEGLYNDLKNFYVDLTGGLPRFGAV